MHHLFGEIKCLSRIFNYESLYVWKRMILLFYIMSWHAIVYWLCTSTCFHVLNLGLCTRRIIFVHVFFYHLEITGWEICGKFRFIESKNTILFSKLSSLGYTKITNNGTKGHVSFIHSFLQLCIRPSVHPSIHLFIYLFIHVSFYSFIHSYIHSFIYFPFLLSFSRSTIDPFIYLSVFLSTYLLLDCTEKDITQIVILSLKPNNKIRKEKQDKMLTILPT